MKAKRGVVETCEKSRARCPWGLGFPVGSRDPSGTTFASQSVAVSMIEWNQTNGLWRVAYWSVAVATSAGGGPPMAGWPQSVPTFGSAVAAVPCRVCCPCPAS